jgi:hypothetical protein
MSEIGAVAELPTPAPALEIVDFRALRGDWYYGVEYVVTLLVRAAKRLQRRELGVERPLLFRAFPLQWIPVFEWLGVGWDDPSPTSCYIPFLSNSDVTAILSEVARAREERQLRLLVETIAGCDSVLAETLPRLDGRIMRERAAGEFGLDEAPSRHHAQIRLTNWHSYGRAEVRRFEDDLVESFAQTKADVIFLPCGRTRPYDRSPTHRRLCRRFSVEGLDMAKHDVIVITSLGPVPKAMWQHPTVLTYDTGIRDVHRVLVLFRRIFRRVHYRTAWDCMALEPYRDLIQILRNEGFVDEVRRLSGIKPKRLSTYAVGRRPR